MLIMCMISFSWFYDNSTNLDKQKNFFCNCEVQSLNIILPKISCV